MQGIATMSTISTDRRRESARADVSRQSSGTASKLSHRAAAALRLLLDAECCARELRRSKWDFAVEIEELRAAGLTNTDLRWLVCKGFVEHAPEITNIGDQQRSFDRQGGLIFDGDRTCFVLSRPGIGFCRVGLATASPAAEEVDGRASPGGWIAGAPRVPTWDRDRQELRLGNILVKQFKVPAANQERILAAFQEEGWPVRILDPLPPQMDQDPKRRLHDTINSLNRNQKNPLVRFSGDGSGQGVRWGSNPSPENGNGSAGE